MRNLWIIFLLIGCAALAWRAQTVSLAWSNSNSNVTFEIWMATNLTTFTATGTNVPAGFTLLTNVPASPVTLANHFKTAFFIVRARDMQTGAVSDWASK